MALWTDGLSSFGKYYAGIVYEKRLAEVLEVHKRATVSTFGTRSSRRVNTAAEGNQVALFNQLDSYTSYSSVTYCCELFSTYFSQPLSLLLHSSSKEGLLWGMCQTYV